MSWFPDYLLTLYSILANPEWKSAHAFLFWYGSPLLAGLARWIVEVDARVDAERYRIGGITFLM